ncbi:MAG: VOC family protein [Gemmatimonadota bacterium]
MTSTPHQAMTSTPLPRAGALLAMAAAAAFLGAPWVLPAQEREPPRPGAETGAIRPPAGAPIAGLEGLDHVVIGVNDLAGAIQAYRRLGFQVADVRGALPGGPGALVDLGGGWLEFAAAPDSAGVARPYTFEGGLGMAWRVRALDAAVDSLGGRGVPFAETASGRDATPWRFAAPDVQPVSGTSVYLVQVDDARLAELVDGVVEGSPLEGRVVEHPNGARGLAYVTIAVRSFREPSEILREWGLDPLPDVEDPRGGRTVEVELPRGRLFLTAPSSGGGINDFLEERRAMAPPVGDRYYEGSILSIGLAVEDLDETVEFLDEHGIAHVSMDLPTGGRTEVVQGAPGWALRLEFVEAPRGAETGPGSPGGSAGEERSGYPPPGGTR